MYPTYPSTIPPPAPTPPRKVVINVANDCAQVSEKTATGYTPAANWKALQNDAVEETVKQGCDGSPGVYDCSPDLARRAVWAASANTETEDCTRLAGRVLYAISEQVPAGLMSPMMETDWNYAFHVFHSEADAQAIAALYGKELLHVRNAPVKVAR